MNSELPKSVSVAVSLIGLAVIGAIWWVVSSNTTPRSDRSTMGCISASGNLWSDVTLYQDSSCGSPLATVIGGKNGQVKLRYPNGSEEWKERSVTTNQYVKADDPAIATKQWIEPSE